MSQAENVWIVPDEVEIVRYSQLIEVYRREGSSLRATAAVIGSTATTVRRHLNAAGIDTRSLRGRHV